MQNSWFGGANLQGANFQDAVLSGSAFHSADLSNANLEGARLDGVYLQNAIMPEGWESITLGLPKIYPDGSKDGKRNSFLRKAEKKLVDILLRDG